MTSHALRTIRPHRTRYRRKVEAMRHIVTSGSTDGRALRAGNDLTVGPAWRSNPTGSSSQRAAGIEPGPLTTNLDPMQSSDERQFWSHPAPLRREYDVRSRIDYPLLDPARGMFRSLLGGFVLWGLIGLVLWTVL